MVSRLAKGSEAWFTAGFGRRVEGLVKPPPNLFVGLDTFKAQNAVLLVRLRLPILDLRRRFVKGLHHGYNSGWRFNPLFDVLNIF